MKIVYFLVLIVTVSLADFWTIKTSSGVVTLDDVSDNLNKVYYANESGLIKIYNASSQYNFALSSTEDVAGVSWRLKVLNAL
jgi:hypothetical protein